MKTLKILLRFLKYVIIAIMVLGGVGLFLELCYWLFQWFVEIMLGLIAAACLAAAWATVTDEQNNKDKL